MQIIVALLLTLGLIRRSSCTLHLQITKNTEDIFVPITGDLLEERAGTSFALQCELISDTTNDSSFDDQISWGKDTEDLQFKNETDLFYIAKHDRHLLQHFLRPSEVNKGIRRFEPLKVSDGGLYFCMSLKHMLFRVVRVHVRSDAGNGLPKINISIPLLNDFCNYNMFKCHIGPFCIPKHYMCDGKADCRDRSDEARELCNGDPCRDKLMCNDGRCIPYAWCCDRHHDSNCTVINRPTCCQLMAESYEEMEYGYELYNIKRVRSSGARYLFISVCVLSSFFSVVLLLMILSKVLIFAKKSSYIQSRTSHFNLEDIAVQRPNLRRSFPYDIRSYRYIQRPSRTTSTAVECSEVVNPLLMPFSIRQDHPPAYSEVVAEQTSASDPPPPYTSRETLNEVERS